MSLPASTRSDNLPGASRTDLALPLAAVISLAITSYVFVVLITVALQKWLTRLCCSTVSDTTTNYCCDICFGSTDDSCCGNSAINCCSSPATLMNCCNASKGSSCWITKLSCCAFMDCCHETSKPIDCQSCDCCCFEIAFHLKSRGTSRPTGSGTIPP